MRLKKWNNLLILLSPILFLASCSITNRIPEGEHLYVGYKNIEYNFDSLDLSKEEKNNVFAQAEEDLYSPANTLLIPGKRKFLPFPTLLKQRLCPVPTIVGPRKWVGNFFGQDAKLLSKVHPEKRVVKLQSNLVNMGYYHTNVNYTIDYKGGNQKKALLHYYVNIQPSYHYELIKLVKHGFEVEEVLEIQVEKMSTEKNMVFSIDDLQQRKLDMAKAMRRNGYFYFSPDNIYFKADTNASNRSVKLYVEIDTTAKSSMKKMYINNINIYQHSKDLDSVSSNDKRYIDTDFATHYFNILYYQPDFIDRNIAISKKQPYNYDLQIETLYRLNNIGSFGGVVVDYDKVGVDSLQANIYITPRSSDVLKVEFNIVTKSNNFTGPSIITSWEKRNLFGGGENWKLSLEGNYEWQTSGSNRSTIGNNSYGFSVTSAYSVPYGVLFFNRDDMKKRFPKTHFDLGYEYVNRAFYYTMTSFNISYAYTWTSSNNKFAQKLDPFYLNRVNVINTTEEFDEILQDNPSLARSFEQQFILGPRYSITYSTFTKKRKNVIYFNNRIASSGNLAFIGQSIARGERIDEENRELLGQEYTQFLKYAGDLRYNYKLKKNSIATRLCGGIGYPIGTSDVMPYVEQFFVGGASSVRSYQARGLGPGSFNASETASSSSFLDQKGDIRLEANVEFRHKLTQMFNTAYFIDAGNIWLVNEDVSRPGSGFGTDFLSEIAIATGLGFRFDFDFLIIRLDGGVSLSQPYLPKGKRSIFTGEGFTPVYSVHFAIGYPF